MTSTVQSVSDPYANFLTPTPGASVGVCSVCRSVVTESWSRCFQCNKALNLLPSTADIVVPMAIAVKGEQLARELNVYKNRPEVGQRLMRGLAAVQWRFLQGHERHIAKSVGLNSEAFEVVSSVPSTSGRQGEHPLRFILSSIAITSDRYSDLLAVNSEVEQGRTFNVDRWRVTASVRGAAVMLMDDTWTTGSRIQSAAAALRRAGAARVAAVVTGRHFDRYPPEQYREDAERYYRMVRAQEWSWDLCCIDRS